jgi:hypothetical protein
MKAKWNAGEVGDSCSVTITDAVYGEKEFGVQEACDILTAEISSLTSALEESNAKHQKACDDYIDIVRKANAKLTELAVAREEAVRAFAEWCDAVSMEEPDALAHPGCGGGCYTDCVDAIDRYLAHLKQKETPK